MNLKNTEDKAGQTGRCKGLEESAAVGFASKTEACTGGPGRHPVLPSGLCPLVQEGAER